MSMCVVGDEVAVILFQTSPKRKSHFDLGGEDYKFNFVKKDNEHLLVYRTLIPWFIVVRYKVIEMLYMSSVLKKDSSFRIKKIKGRCACSFNSGLNGSSKL